MSNSIQQTIPPGFRRGPLQGGNLIGEVTEGIHRWLLDGWPEDSGRPPRVEEDLSFVPKDREEVVYVYMYRLAKNSSLKNTRRWTHSRLMQAREDHSTVLYERAPLYLEVYYLVSVHSRFRSEAERLLGWVMMRLNAASHLIYRPRKHILPTGEVVDSLGRDWDLDADGEVDMEKVSLTMVDDLTVGDAVNFFTIHEAPFRPYVTYQALCAMRGPMMEGPPTTIAHPRTDPWSRTPPNPERPGGRMPQGGSSADSPSRPPVGPTTTTVAH